MPRKTIRGGQMDLAAQWKTRPAWLESSWEKCRSNNWDWSRVDKHELCQLDVSTMPCGLETLSINILKLYQRCHGACARRSGRSSHVMLQQIFVFSPTCCITFRKDTFDFSYKMSSKKSKGVKVIRRCTRLAAAKWKHMQPLDAQKGGMFWKNQGSFEKYWVRFRSIN